MFNIKRLFCIIFLSYLSVHAVNFNHLSSNFRKFVVVTASYNNIKFVDKYLESVFSQKYDESKFTFRVIYYDDCSEDGTGDFVEVYKSKFNLGDKFKIIRNKSRVGAHENIYNAVHSCKDDEIVLIVDGDDWLARNDVLEILYKIYSDPNVWITYGQYKRFPDGKLGVCSNIPREVIETNSFRTYKWVSSHLRTFYAWLYKCIKKEDVMYNDKYVPVCGDLAIMFPMLEMASFHSRFIPDILYIYNKNVSVYGKKKLKRKLNGARVNYRRKNKSHNIHKVIEHHIRKELIPYAPLRESYLGRYN